MAMIALALFAMIVSNPKTVEREFSVLEAVPDSFPKTVLTLDRIPMKRNGIHHYYLPAWLLGQVN